MGATGADGAMGGSLAAIGKIRRESVDFTKEESDTFELEIEESTHPDFEAIQDGKPFMFMFNTYDVTPANLSKAFGGTALTNTWNAAVLDTLLEQSVEITTKSVEGYHVVIQIPRASVKGALQAPLQRGDAGSIKFTCKALVPEDSGGVLLSPVSITLAADA